MSRITDSQSLGSPLGVPLRVQKLVLVLIAIFAVYGFATKNVIQAVWFPLLYLSIYLHELGHALSARALRGHVEGIAIHIVGGVTMSRGVRGAWPRVLMTAAGPAVNLALGLLLRYLVLPATAPGALGSVVYGLMFANLLWGFFNLLPIYPLDGGQILATVVEQRLSPVKATAVSALVSLVAIGVTAVVSLAGAGFLGLEGVGSGMLLLFLVFFAWVNVQRWQAAREAGGASSNLGGSIGRAARNGGSVPGRPEPQPQPRPRPKRGRSLRDLAEDADHMRSVLSRGAKVGLGGLSPDDRRLVMLSRTMLEAQLNRTGFAGLSEDERDLLALHHEMEDRAAH